MTKTSTKKNKKKAIRASIYNNDYFLSECSGYESFCSNQSENAHSRFANAMKYVGNPHGKYILDLGCGRGEVTKNLALRGARVVGLDYSKSALQLSTSNVSRNESSYRLSSFIQADAKEIPLLGGSMDVVVILDVVEHLHQWELEKTLRLVKDILKPNGSLIIHTAPNKLRRIVLYSIARFFARFIHNKRLPLDFRSTRDRIVHVNEQTPLSLWKTLRKAGFIFKIWSEDSIGKGGSMVGMDEASRVLKLWPFKFLFGFRIWALARKKQ